MINANVFGDIHPTVWECQILTFRNEKLAFHFRNYAIKSDWLVYIENAGVNFCANKSKNVIFTLVEPSEIYVDGIEFLKYFK